jgi:hypothetical protein
MLHYGAQFVRLETFVLAAAWLLFSLQAFKNDLGAGELRQASSSVRIMRAVLSKGGLSLGNILFQGVGLQCSEPRDRVFGILGLTRRGPKQRPMSVDLAPDYTKSVAEVYYEATRACIVEFPLYWGLDSFGYERGEGDVIEELPTWVPNWYCGSFRWNSTKNRARRLPEHAKLWTYQDPPANRCLVPESSSGKILSIRGVVLETIAECSKAFDRFDKSGRLEFMSSACTLLPNEHTHAGTGVEQFNRLHHVLGAGSHDSTEIRRCMDFLESYPGNCNGVYSG